MSDKKNDRVSFQRHAQRKESYKNLISKRKHMLSFNNLKTISKLKLATTKAMKEEYEEEDNMIKTDSVSPNSPTSSDQSFSDSSQDFQFGISSKFKLDQSSTSKNELDISSVMTRSATRKYATVGAIHNKVDWVQQLKIKKQWPVNVAYPIQGPIIQNIDLRNILSRSLDAVMSFCKNVWVTDNGVNTGWKEDQIWIFKGTQDFFDLASYPLQVTDTLNGNESNTMQQQTIKLISNKDQQGTFCNEQMSDKVETITLYPDETYLIDKEYVNSKNIQPNAIKDDVCEYDHYNPMDSILHDHNYAQKCDVPHTKKLKVEHQKLVRKEKEEFKMENALNDLLLNTAILKCLVCGESPQDMISVLDGVQT